MRILQIEAESSTTEAVELMLKTEDIFVASTDRGEEGIELAKLYPYDLILLDLNLPDMSGFEVLRMLRTAKVTVPVVVLTSEIAVEAKVRAFETGADDYLTKPFHKDELVARIRAIVRRSLGHAESVVTIGDLKINISAQTVSMAGKPIHLTAKEYQMVELLALRKGATLTKEMFLNHLYGGMDEPEMKIVDVFICKIRKKFREAGADKYVSTVWGRGYILSAPDAIAV